MLFSWQLIAVKERLLTNFTIPECHCEKTAAKTAFNLVLTLSLVLIRTGLESRYILKEDLGVLKI